MTKRYRKQKWAALGMLCAVLFASLPIPVFADGGNTLSEIEIIPDNRLYDWVKDDTVNYIYDFTETNINAYSQDEVLSTASLRTSMIFDGQTLACKEGKTFSFGSKVFLGDDYGLYGGELSFDANVSGGKLSIGIRLSRTAPNTDYRGIWFTFDGTDTVTISEPESKFSATVKISGVASVGKLTVRDKASIIELLLDETLLCSVTYDSYTGAIVVLDGQGNTVASKESTKLRPAGYFTLFADSMVGTIDNLTFEHNNLTVNKNVNEGLAIDYTTWVATDDRDRTTPMGVEVREDKQVGIFYFLCQTGEDTDFIQDNTRIFLENGLEGLNDHLTDPKEGGAYYWAEPYFGYYKNVDSWVFRKHAYQLEAAGVDFIFLDFTNGAYYQEALMTLLDVWLEIRKEGGSTPEICVFSASRYAAVMEPLRSMIYSEEGFAKYGELFYQYKGKPLTLANLNGNTGELETWISETFTVRKCWAWLNDRGCWNWLQEYTQQGNNFRYSNGGPGRDIEGNFEELALCIGHHPTTSKGRSFANATFPTINGNDYGFSLDSGAGLGFAAQFEAIMHFDPNMVLITGWNEWVAGLNHTSSGYSKFAGSTDLGFQFVDQFNTEYSRDAEPMKLRQGEEVGFGDNYYYQMTSYIRQYKGTGAVSQASGQTSISLADNTTWTNVGPVYSDNVNDIAWRSQDGYFVNCNYVNNTGRNDLVSTKVSQDAEYLYFLVNTAENIVVDDGANWMNLYIDLDNDPATGWEGYDLALNRARDNHYVAVESLEKGWEGAHIGQALYTVEGNQMVIRLAKSVIGVRGHIATLCFKWADNSTLIGNVMEFMDLGDTAPNDRFSYMYVCPETEGVDTVAVPTYSLIVDGSVEKARDEDDALPGYTDTKPSVDTTDDTTNETDHETESSEGNDTEKLPTVEAKVTWKYSLRLKVMIVLCGVVTGISISAVLLIPDIVRRKKKS